MVKKMDEKKVIDFNSLKKEYQERELENKEVLKNERQAEEYFQKAKSSEDNEVKYELAHTAFILCPYKYYYEVYAVLFLKKDQKLEALKRIYNYINNGIENKNPYFKEDEKKSAKYGYFLYTYACSLIEYRYLDEALKLLLELEDNYYRFKAIHLILNIYAYQNEFKKLIEYYNINRYEDVSSFIPLSFAYLKLDKYKEFVDLIKKINIINPNFKEVLNSANENRLENCSNETYKIADSSEIYYAFKYFYKLYYLNQEYLKAVNNILDEND